MVIRVLSLIKKNKQQMDKKKVFELVVKIIVAALTAALTAITTTSCMGRGPVAFLSMT